MSIGDLARRVPSITAEHKTKLLRYQEGPDNVLQFPAARGWFAGGRDRRDLVAKAGPIVEPILYLTILEHSRTIRAVRRPGLWGDLDGCRFRYAW